MALGTNLQFYTSVAKRLKLKVRKFWGLVPTFVEVTGEELIRGAFLPPPPLPLPILNRVKKLGSYYFHKIDFLKRSLNFLKKHVKQSCRKQLFLNSQNNYNKLFLNTHLDQTTLWKNELLNRNFLKDTIFNKFAIIFRAPYFRTPPYRYFKYKSFYKF